MPEEFDRPAAANSFVTKAEQRKKRKEALSKLHEEALEPEVEETVTLVPAPEEKPKESKTNKPPLVRKTYYITEKQYKDIRMLSVTSGRDTSAIVRAAITEYLKNETSK